MISKKIAFLLTFPMIPCPLFATENDITSTNLSNTSSQHQETLYQQRALNEGVIWNEFRPNSPNQYEDIYSTYKVYSKNNDRGLIWENAWLGDQIALQKVISKRWYNGSKLAKLMQFVIMPMVQNKSPVATKILRDLMLRDEIETHVNGRVNEFLKTFIINEADKGDQRFQLKVLEAYALGEYGINPKFKKNKQFSREKLYQYAVIDKNPKAQVFFIDAHKKGYFGIRKKNVGNRKNAMYFLKEFSKQGNHTIQMYRVYTYAEGWFGIDPTLPSSMSRALNLAAYYAYNDNNREAQEFLVNTYANGELNTRKDKDRYKKLSQYRNAFNLWPETLCKKAYNQYYLLASLEDEE